MKFTYCEDSNRCWIEPFNCTGWYCDADCDCGMTFDQAKGMVVDFYEHKFILPQNSLQKMVTIKGVLCRVTTT